MRTQRQAVDGFGGRVPRAHEANAGFADECVEPPAHFVQRIDRAGRQNDEDAVRLHRREQSRFGQ